MRLLKNEKKQLAELLEQGAETPEVLVEMFVKKLDQLRGERGHLWYARVLTLENYGAIVGPFTTPKQAEKAANKLTGKTAYVMPGWTAEGLEVHLANVDKPAKPQGDYAEIAEDAAAFKRGWKGNRKDRKDYVS